ncbi:hypothetical protein OUZ56_026434 [Daphnia magna]|nr:hypothetical protein OUZ56_026434 [Daphnia magna]
MVTEWMYDTLPEACLKNPVVGVGGTRHGNLEDIKRFLLDDGVGPPAFVWTGRKLSSAVDAAPHLVLQKQCHSTARLPVLPTYGSAERAYGRRRSHAAGRIGGRQFHEGLAISSHGKK